MNSPEKGFKSENLKSVSESTLEIRKAIDFCEQNGLALIARPRSYGYALYAEDAEQFPGWERKTTEGGSTTYSKRLGGFRGKPPEEAMVVNPKPGESLEERRERVNKDIAWLQQGIEGLDKLCRHGNDIGFPEFTGFFTMSKSGQLFANAANGLPYNSELLSPEEKGFAANHLKEMIRKDRARLEEMKEEE